MLWIWLKLLHYMEHAKYISNGKECKKSRNKPKSRSKQEQNAKLNKYSYETVHQHTQHRTHGKQCIPLFIDSQKEINKVFKCFQFFFLFDCVCGCFVVSIWFRFLYGINIFSLIHGTFHIHTICNMPMCPCTVYMDLGKLKYLKQHYRYTILFGSILTKKSYFFLSSFTYLGSIHTQCI